MIESFNEVIKFFESYGGFEIHEKHGDQTLVLIRRNLIVRISAPHEFNENMWTIDADTVLNFDRWANAHMKNNFGSQPSRDELKEIVKYMYDHLENDIPNPIYKVYLDDERQTPEGCIRTWSAKGTIDLLKTRAVRELSLDHDLGENPSVGNGYDVLLWIEEEVWKNDGYIPPAITIHSANPPARRRMEQAVRSIYTAHIMISNGIIRP